MRATREVMEHTVEGPVVWFIRHPINRIQSCYSYFTETGWEKLNPSTYESFVDAVLEGETNRHWDSQVSQVTHGSRFLPTEIYRFEDIQALWPKVIGTELPHKNQSTPQDIDKAYRIDELAAFYRMDLEIWQAADH